MKTFDPDDLPDTYYILGTVHGFRFVLDVEEGERVGGILDNLQFVKNEKFAGFLRFKDYASVVARVQFDLIDSFYMSTEESRAFEACFNTDAKKRGWNQDDD
jgi:hypothetical protein